MAIDSENIFYEKIKNYYSIRNKKFLSEDIINKLSSFLADHLFKQYSNFRKEYPKSKKRYSSLKLNDLENPIVHDMIISFMKDNYKNDYIKLCSIIFNLDEIGFIEYESKRRKFNRIF